MAEPKTSAYIRVRVSYKAEPLVSLSDLKISYFWLKLSSSSIFNILNVSVTAKTKNIIGRKLKTKKTIFKYFVCKQ